MIPAVKTASTTPANPILCQAGQHSDGTRCVPDPVTPTPPKPITCPTGQHSNGVTCVPDGNNCPIYNACPPGYTSHTSVDTNGCTKLQCVAPVSTSFSATPTSGAAPLTVSFTATPGGNLANQYIIEFDDGTFTDSSYLQFPLCNAGSTCSASATHTYAAAGTYTARLMDSHCPVGKSCGGGPVHTAVGMVTITVR